jgi:ABC-type uncharacterized transport system permease subunit
MLQLPTGERHVFITVLVIYFISSILAVRQLHRSDDKCRRMLISLVALAVSLQSLILVFRSVAIQAIPLTSLFESMIVLSIAFGLTFLFLSIVIRQIWFSSVMIWFIFGLVLLSAFAASPASQLQSFAKTPWVVLHGLSMSLSGAAIAFSGALAALFLITRRNLKSKKIFRIIGKMPNIEKLELFNVIGIKVAFVLLTFGWISGAGMAIIRSADISLSFHDWITDSKIILVMVAWLLLGAILGLRHILELRGRIVAQMTLVACFLIIFAIIGSEIFCGTGHEFSDKPVEKTNSGSRQ